MITLEQAREVMTAHADHCINPQCWRLKHALDSASYASALALIRDTYDPGWRDTSDLPPWSEVTRSVPDGPVDPFGFIADL